MLSLPHVQYAMADIATYPSHSAAIFFHKCTFCVARAGAMISSVATNSNVPPQKAFSSAGAGPSGSDASTAIPIAMPTGDARQNSAHCECCGQTQKAKIVSMINYICMIVWRQDAYQRDVDPAAPHFHQCAAHRK